MEDAENKNLETLVDLIAEVAEENGFKIRSIRDGVADLYECHGPKITVQKDSDTLQIGIDFIADWYDSDYGDDKVCKCGHRYYRHFDSYSVRMEAIGCKYCGCYTFEEGK